MASPPRSRALLALLAVAAAGTVAAPASAERAPTNLGVTGDEFTIVFSRPAIDPGPSLVQFSNAGEDAHDLAWKRVGSDAPPRTIGEVQPGEQSARTDARFRAGTTYRFWCTIADHRLRGMRATLRVRR